MNVPADPAADIVGAKAAGLLSMPIRRDRLGTGAAMPCTTILCRSSPRSLAAIAHPRIRDPRRRLVGKIRAVIENTNAPVCA